VRTRLEVGVDPVEVLRQFDVYLDGVLQTKCLVADVKAGFVRRYVRTGIPASWRPPRVEYVRGVVEIKPK